VVPAVVAAMITLACSELGYVLATSVRGGSSSSSTVAFWLAAAALAGPPLGVAGSWSSEPGSRREVGASSIGGVLLGEGVYGWSTLSGTTDWRYWAVEATIGAVVIVFATARARRPRAATLAFAAGVATAAVVLAAGRLA
jgi:hypothetical protein